MVIFTSSCSGRKFNEFIEDSKINESLCSPKISSYVEIDISALLLFVRKAKL